MGRGVQTGQLLSSNHVSISTSKPPVLMSTQGTALSRAASPQAEEETKSWGHPRGTWKPSAHTYPLVLGFPSHFGHHRALGAVPGLCGAFLFVIYFMHSTVYISVSISQCIPPLLFPLGVQMFVLYICICGI